ncbi:hypothetical protein ACTXT7_000122 [Hymenolepis weldensis]
MKPEYLFAETILFLTNTINVWTAICPRGYWSAHVESLSNGKGINQFTSDRNASLRYIPTGNEPICRFCPNISCFIMRQVYDRKDSASDARKPRKSRNSTKILATTPKPVELFTQSTFVTSSSTYDTNKETNITMSCAPYSDLPFPEQIITYLDCVQIGQKDHYYLYIYTPVNKEDVVEPVDCIDPNFLKWIPKRERIKSLELGFPMRRLPPYFFRYYPDIMEKTEHVCIDSSAMLNNEIDPSDMQRFDGKVLTQVVFRHQGLKRNVLPPKEPPNTANTGCTSDEIVAECPRLAASGMGKTFPDRDCRYAASEMPINNGTVNKEDIEKSCPCVHCFYQKPEIQMSKAERNRLPVPKYVTTLFNMALLALVLFLIFGTVLGFCVNNKDKAMILFLTRTRKRKREWEEALAREAAERAAKEAEEQNLVNWNPFLNRYGMLAGGGAMGGFGPFSSRLPIGDADDATGGQFGGAQQLNAANQESAKGTTRKRR